MRFEICCSTVVMCELLGLYCARLFGFFGRCFFLPVGCRAILYYLASVVTPLMLCYAYICFYIWPCVKHNLVTG